MPPPPGKARNYLSIDGGINPLSALYIINEMLQRLKFDVKSEEDLKACDWFNLITGSGHGGLIALLLGRLQMTTSQAIKAYHSLATVLVTEPTESKQEREMNGRMFRDAFENILMDAGYAVDSPMHPEVKKNDPCKCRVYSWLIGSSLLPVHPLLYTAKHEYAKLHDLAGRLCDSCLPRCL